MNLPSAIEQKGLTGQQIAVRGYKTPPRVGTITVGSVRMFAFGLETVAGGHAIAAGCFEIAAVGLEIVAGGPEMVGAGKETDICAW